MQYLRCFVQCRDGHFMVCRRTLVPGAIQIKKFINKHLKSIAWIHDPIDKLVFPQNPSDHGNTGITKSDIIGYPLERTHLYQKSSPLAKQLVFDKELIPPRQRFAMINGVVRHRAMFKHGGVFHVPERKLAGPSPKG